MSVCRVCNAPITWAVTEVGERVPLDDHEEQDSGPGRYRVLRETTPPVIARIPEESTLRTTVDHRLICQRPRAA